jgi:hypothetical protein
MSEIPPGHPQTPQEARELVEQRRRTVLEGYESDNEFIQELAYNYDQDVKRDLDTPAQVIPELLQNADDVEECSAVEIEISEDELVVRNNGRPLLEHEFEALCHIGKSTKQEPGYIGHFGRGFKSVFSVSDNPQIRSGFLRFEFERERCVLPEHLVDEAALDEINYAPGTEVRLPLTDLSDHARSQLLGQIESLHRLIPYLRHVSKVYVVDDGNRTCYRREMTERGKLTEVDIYKNDSLQERQHIFSIECVPPDDEFAELVEHRALENEEKFRDEPVPIKISFPVDEEGKPQPRDGPSRLFNFFPTKDELPIPFDIQADFLLDSDRKRLNDEESAYNQWIFNHVSTAYEGAVDYYLRREPPSAAFLNLVPTRRTLDSYLRVIQNDILDVLREHECIPGQDDEWHLPKHIIVPDSRLEGLLSESDIQELLGEDTHYPADSLTQRRLNNLIRLGLLDELTIDNLARVGQESEVYRQKSPSELLHLASLFNEVWEDTYRSKRRYNKNRQNFLSAVKKIPLIPLQGSTVISSNDADLEPVLPPEDEGDEYVIFTDRLTLVDLTIDEPNDDGDEEVQEAIVADARAFFENVIGLSVVEDEFIITEVIAEAFKNSSEETDSTLDEFLEFIIRDNDRQDIADRNNAIRLRIKAPDSSESVYKRPSELYLPQDYSPQDDGGEYKELCLPQDYSPQDDGLDHDLEPILLDIDAAQFVSPSYRDLRGSRSRWRRFLMSLGVKNKLKISEENGDSRQKFRTLTDLEEALESAGDTSTDPPQAPKHSGDSYDTWLKHYKYALSDYVVGDAFDAVLNTIAERGPESEQQARELATMLASCWDYYEDRLYKELYYADRWGKGNPFRARNQETQCPSEFATKIRNTAWCPTKAGTLRPPSALLADIPRTQGQPDERYLDDNLPFSEKNYAGLDISTRLDPSVVLKLLVQAPTVWGESDPSKIRTEVSDQLDQFKAGLSDCSTEEVDELLSDLRTAPFLYIEAAETQFRTPSQVVLEGISLGNEFVSISTLYTRHHQFLHKQVDVQQRVQIDDCLDFLADHSGEEFTDEELKAWNQTLEQLLSELDVLSEQEFSNLEALERLEQETVVPTHSGTTAQLTEIEFYCFDEMLLEVTEQEVDSRVIREPASGNLTQNRLTPLWEILGLEDLRDTVELDLDLADNVVLEPARVVDEDDRVQKLLTVCQSYLEASEESRDDERDELVALSGYDLYDLKECAELQGYYSLNGQRISERLPLQSYVDRANGRILRAKGNESYFDLAAKLADELQLPSKLRDELRSLLSGAVGTEPGFLKEYLDDHDIDFVPYSEQSMEESGATNPEESTEDSAEESEETPASEASGKDKLSTDTDSDPEPSSNPSSSTGAGTSPGANASTNSSSGGSSSSSQSTADTGSDAHEPSFPDQRPGNGYDSGAKNSCSEPSTFDPEVAPSAIDSRTAIDNRPESISCSGGSGSPPGKEHGNGDGGNGGRAAHEVGAWGEEFVVTALVDELRTELSDKQVSVTWFWGPRFLELSECAHESDNLDSQTQLGINRNKLSESVPGVKIEGTDTEVRVLYIRDAKLGGGDILIDGVDLTITEAGSELLTQVQPAENAETWIEVKSSVGTTNSFKLTITEYGRAREQQDNYCVITLCQVGTPDLYIDRRLCDIATLSDRGKIELKKNGELRINY